MGTVRESERDVPIAYEADVAVVGGSCTGVFAAVRAARLGMRVAIIEKQNCFGGVATAGAVNVWHSLNDTEGSLPIIGGLTQEVIDRLGTRDAIARGESLSTTFRLNTEELKIELDELITENKIEPFLHTFYAAPVVEDGALAAVIIENKNGRQAITARQFVDATGDADLALHLGLPSHEQGPLQPPSTCAKIYGLKALGDFDWESAISEHGPEFGLEPDWGWGGPIPGMPEIQMRADTHVFDTDASDATQLTKAEIEGRRRIRAVMDIIRKYGPPEASIALADLAAVIGARETRRIHARYQLTGDDVLTGRRFDDAIANGSYPVDTHHAGGAGITFKYMDGTQLIIPERGAPGQSGRWRDPLPEDPTFYQIPFRCLTQDKVPNLVLAGRMLDADKIAFSAVRVMVNMNQTGEAAGVACALASQNDCPVADVDPKRLRDTLAEGGSIIL
ncbi:FAD-dependent oxidoreductase [Planctomycetota bacterium]